MNLRRMLPVVLVAVGAALPGCSLPCSTCGWRFEVGKPATFFTPGLVQQQSGPLMVNPLGSTLPPVISDVAAQLTNPSLKASVAPHILGRRTGPEECSLEDVCRMLQRIEAKLQAGERIPAPMPKGPLE